MTFRSHHTRPRIRPLLLISVLGWACQPPYDTSQPISDQKSITILYTNDEHGWMEGVEEGQGAAELLGLWKDQEGYVADSSFLILSGGDMWTGPAISTWFEGESMAEVMNTMGYDAAAIGNHEFDFKTVATRKRAGESSFPFLSANIRQKSDGLTPDFAKRYIVKTVGGLRVAIIGLTTTSTPYTAFPDYVADYDFIDYEQALADVLPDIEAENTDVTIVISHVCASDLNSLASYAASHGIALLAGGHCHATYNQFSDGVAIIEAGEFLKTYGVINLYFDPQSKALKSVDLKIKNNVGGSTQLMTQSIITAWKSRLDGALAEVIAYSSNGVAQHSDAMHNLVPDTWLWRNSQVDIAATNYGGYRQDLPSGNITIADIVGVLPFTNTINIVKLRGDQLIALFDSRSVAPGGATLVGGYFHADGTPIKLDSTYSLMITDYMYSAYPEIALIDTMPIMTGENWREPVIDWLKQIGSSAVDPLENYLDVKPRR